MLLRILAAILLWSPASAAPTPAKSPRQELKELVAQLQSSPSDQALREKIIALALKLKPAPAASEEARRRMARGEAAFEATNDARGYEKAADEFQAAANAAPWLASAYYNLGLAQEKAGKPAEAMKSLKLYLLAAPGAKDAVEIEKKVFKLEYALEEGAGQPAASLEKAAPDFRGRWALEGNRNWKYRIDVSGEHLTMWELDFRDREHCHHVTLTGTVSGNEFQGSSNTGNKPCSSEQIVSVGPVRGRLSADGQRLDVEHYSQSINPNLDSARRRLAEEYHRESFQQAFVREAQ